MDIDMDMEIPGLHQRIRARGKMCGKKGGEDMREEEKGKIYTERYAGRRCEKKKKQRYIRKDISSFFAGRRGEKEPVPHAGHGAAGGSARWGLPVCVAWLTLALARTLLPVFLFFFLSSFIPVFVG